MSYPSIDVGRDRASPPLISYESNKKITYMLSWRVVSIKHSNFLIAKSF